jgi:hypothetical protein
MKDRASERIEFINLNGANEPALFDLSKTGVCCFSAKKKEKDGVATVRLNDMALKAKVIYCQDRTDGFRLGMQFQSVTADQQKKLDELVDKFSRGVPIACTVEE